MYCETAAAIPDDSEQIEGVQYILMDDGGCLVDADGKVVLNTGIFLDLYGDGENYDCDLGLYGPTLIEEGKIYAVRYCNQIFILDSKLNPIRPVFDETIVAAFQSADFYETFCYYYDETEKDWVIRTYDGEPFLTSYGTVPDHIEKVWGSNAYLMYWQVGNQLFVEEYTDDGDLVKYTIHLEDGVSEYDFYYTPEGYVVLNEFFGEMLQSPYQEEMMLPKYRVSLLYQGNPLDVDSGLGGGDIYALDDTHLIWCVRNGNRFTAPSESIFEDFVYSYALGNYSILNEQTTICELDNAYLLYQGNQTLFFIKGNYIYAMDNDGTEYLRALHTFMSTD